MTPLNCNFTLLQKVTECCVSTERFASVDVFSIYIFFVHWMLVMSLNNGYFCTLSTVSALTIGNVRNSSASLRLLLGNSSVRFWVKESFVRPPF